MKLKFTTFVHQDDRQKVLNLIGALHLAADLYHASQRNNVLHPEPKDVSMHQKLTHSGFAEHGNLQRAFLRALRVGTNIHLPLHGQIGALVEVRFFESGQKNPFFWMDGSCNIDTGQATVSSYGWTGEL